MRRIVRPTLLALFFLSGACGLVYEVVWMRMLTLVFGATALATSTVLASFFSGLAAGSFLFGRVADRSRRLLTIYAALEAGVALCALAMPFVLGGVTEVYVALARRLSLGWPALTAIRFALSFLALVIPATLMGGTLPVVVRYFTTRGDHVGLNVGRLYAVNTFGAVVGAMGAGFFLILLLGAREATWLAAAVNLFIAGVVMVLARQPDGALTELETLPVAESAEPMADEAADAALDVETGPPPAPVLSPGLARLALWSVGISGMCALALEVLWTRSLVYFLDNSTHAFTTILTAFLLGIALGSAIIARWIDGRRRPLAWLGWIGVLVGVTAAAAIPILTHSTPVLQRMAEVTIDNSLWYRWTGMRFLAALSVMVVPTALMGMTVPLVTRIYAVDVAGFGTAVGRVYAVNTLGGVVGSLAAGFLVIPWIGLQNGIVLVAALNVLLGAVLVLADPGNVLTLRGRLVAGAAVLVGVASAAWLGRGGMVLSSYIERMDGVEVLSYDEGVGATVKVFRDEEGAKYISIDGFPVAGTSLGLQDAQKALGNIPLLLSNAPHPRVNLIGFGAGGASWGSLQYDVEKVDCVELVPGVIRAASWFPEANHGVLSQPRYQVFQDDGRNYALTTDETYDVIAIDATSPKMAGDGSLYTLDFYRVVEQRLSENGLVAVWLPFHLLSDREMRMTARTFLEVFPHATLWLSAIRHHALLIGTRDKLRIDLAAMEEKLRRPGVQQDLAVLRVSQPVDVIGGFVMGEEGLAAYAEGARLNTDDHPYLEFTPAMAYFVARRYLVENLANFLRYRQDPWALLVNTGATPEQVEGMEARVRMRVQSTQHNIAGDIYFYLDKMDEARTEYRNALQIDPADKNWANPAWDVPIR